MSERPAKTQISLGIRPVWSESSLCAQWIAKDPSFHHADSEETLIRLGGWPGWFESSLGAQPFCWFCHVAGHMEMTCKCYNQRLPDIHDAKNKTGNLVTQLQYIWIPLISSLNKTNQDSFSSICVRSSTICDVSTLCSFLISLACNQTFYHTKHNYARTICTNSLK